MTNNDKALAAPKDGFQYVEIHFPLKGAIMKGAIDCKSLDKIIDTVLKAEVDREYVYKKPTAQSSADLAKVREALESAWNGLTWYREEHPQDASEADNEMDKQIEEALRILDEVGAE